MSGDPQDRRRAGVQAIVEALNAGRPEVAFARCEALLASMPDDPAVTQLAATAALRMRRHEASLALAQRSLLGRPDHVPTLILLGRAARGLGASLAAVAAFRRAVDLDPARAESALLLRVAMIEAGGSLSAEDLDALASRFPKEVAGWDDLAEALLAKGRREAALACLSVLAARAPSLGVAMRRGLIAKDLGRAAEARQAFTEAAAIDPRSARAWFLLGVAAQDAHDDAAAATAYGRALALDATLAEAAVNLGTVLQRGGDLDGAKAAYAKALATRPTAFGRVAQAMTSAPKGELWLDLDALRRHLSG